MKKSVLHICLPLFLIMVLSACLSDSDCYTDAVTVVNVNFRKLETNQQDTVVYDSIKINALPDTVFKDFRDTLVSAISLPLDPINNFTDIIFYSHEVVADENIFFQDTLKLSYKVVPLLLGEDCGPVIIFNDLQAELVSTDLNSEAVVSVVDEKLEVDTETNVEIFQ